MNKFNLNSSLKNKLVILLYHGVTEDENTGIINYQGKHINHIEFEKQISFVSKNCSLISIDDWLQIKKVIQKYLLILQLFLLMMVLRIIFL